MTPTEAELLRAFVVAAREYYRLRCLPSGDLNPDSYKRSRVAFERADAALSAYRAAPAVKGEMVEVKGAVLQNGDEYFVVNEGEETRYNGAVRARFTVPVPLPVIRALPDEVGG